MPSKNSQKPSIEKVTWKGIRENIAKVNPKFAKIVDDLSPGPSYYMYRIRYPYGAMIFNKSILQLPNASGELVPITHHTIPNEFREQLCYRVIPMHMVLKKSIELFAEAQGRLIPYTVLGEGGFSGLWESFDPSYSYFVKMSWNVSSGARSIFMLPKITEAIGYKRLQRDFGVKINPPNNLMDQWQVFKAIAKSPDFPDPWASELLFFPKKWFDQFQKENEWLELQRYFYSTVWSQSKFWRFLVTLNLVWQEFSSVIKQKHLPWGSYQLETLKHLVMLAVGQLSSFSAQDPFEITAPLNSFKEAYLNSYGVTYAPTIFIPHHLNMNEKGSCGYYSISEPTLVESVPKTREISNLMQVTRETKSLFDNFREEVKNGELFVENTPIYEMIDKVDFEFFHNNYDKTRLLSASNDLPKKDPSLIAMPANHYKRPFCYSGKFLHGGVRLIVH